MPSFLAGAGRGAQQSLQNMLARRRQEFLEERQFAVEEAERKRQREREEQRDAESKAATLANRLKLFSPDQPLTEQHKETLIAGGFGDIIDERAQVSAKEAAELYPKDYLSPLTPLRSKIPLDLRKGPTQVTPEQALGEVIVKTDPQTQSQYRFSPDEDPRVIDRFMKEVADESDDPRLAPVGQLVPVGQDLPVTLKPEQRLSYLKKTRAEQAAEIERVNNVKRMEIESELFRAQDPAEVGMLVQDLVQLNVPLDRMKDLLDVKKEIFKQAGMTVASVFPSLAGTPVGDLALPYKDGAYDISMAVDMMELQQAKSQGQAAVQAAGWSEAAKYRDRFRTENANALKARTAVTQMRTALNRIRTDVTLKEAILKGDWKSGDYNAAAQSILVTFQKILDPTSVVRESEYMRTPAGLAIASRLRGIIEGFRLGGAGVPVNELESFVSMAEAFYAEQQATLVNSANSLLTIAQGAGVPQEALPHIITDETTLNLVMSGAFDPNTKQQEAQRGMAMANQIIDRYEQGGGETWNELSNKIYRGVVQTTNPGTGEMPDLGRTAESWQKGWLGF